jgi:hypothetical protein
MPASWRSAILAPEWKRSPRADFQTGQATSAFGSHPSWWSLYYRPLSGNISPGRPLPWCSSFDRDGFDCLVLEKKDSLSRGPARIQKQFSEIASSQANQEPLETFGQEAHAFGKVHQAACFFTETRSRGRPKPARRTKSGSKARRYSHARNI